MSLKNLLAGQKLQVINLSVIKELNFCKYLVGDSSCLAILNVTQNANHQKDILIGKTVKLIKPEIIDHKTLKTNKNFRPLKATQQINITPSDAEIAKFENKEESDKESDKNVTN